MKDIQTIEDDLSRTSPQAEEDDVTVINVSQARRNQNRYWYFKEGST